MNLEHLRESSGGGFGSHRELQPQHECAHHPLTPVGLTEAWLGSSGKSEKAEDRPFLELGVFIGYRAVEVQESWEHLLGALQTLSSASGDCWELGGSRIPERCPLEAADVHCRHCGCRTEKNPFLPPCAVNWEQERKPRAGRKVNKAEKGLPPYETRWVVGQ